MSFTRSTLTLSLLAAFALHSPLLLASDDYNYTSINSEDDQFSDDVDDSLEDFYGDEEFISIATGTKKAIHKAPSVATVITADDIKSMGANSIYEALESVTGIHIYPSNLDRMKPNFSIRGIHTSENPQTLLLVNGIRAKSESTGSRWEQFNIGINLIERIEVIKGPGSAIYGADAYSGVINIITKGTNSDSAIEFGAKLGSFNSKTSWVNYINSDNELKYSFNAQWIDIEGDDSRVVDSDAMHSFGLDFLSLAPRSLDSRTETMDINAQVDYQNFYGSVWYLESEGGTGAGAAQALSNRDVESVESLTLTSGYKWEANDVINFDFTAHYQTFDDDTYFMIYPPGMALPREFDEQGVPTAFTVFTDGLIGHPIVQEQHYGANIVAHYTGLEQHRIRMELGFRNTKAEIEEYKNFGPGALNGTEMFKDDTLTNVTNTPYIFMHDQKRDSAFISLQDEWQLAADWELTAGVRYDNYSDFGSTINPRMAIVWQTKHNLTIKYLYGVAFRSPSFQELYAINNPIVLGNKDLEPEEIKTYEIAFDYRMNFDWKLLANIFSYKSEKMIRWLPNGDGTNTAQNADQQDGYGIELEAHWRVNDALKVKAGYAWQDSEMADTGDTVADAPGKMFDLSFIWQATDSIDLHLDTRWILDRERLATDPRNDISNYNTTNLALTYRLSNNIEAQLSVRNLFDEEILEASDGQIAGDYPLDSRGFWLSIDYTL